MKLKQLAAACLAGLSICCAQSALASHIDPNLGVGVSLFSSDGAGNFTLQFDEYMSPYTDAWVGTLGGPGAWDATFSSPNLVFSVTGATITGATTGALNYQGIVDSTGTIFYNVPATTWAVNIDGNGDTTDAAKYSALFSYQITGFDSNLTYSITAAVTDCCADVPPPDLVSKSAQITFNPSVSSVPVPGAVWLLGSGLIGMLGFSRKQRNLISAS